MEKAGLTIKPEDQGKLNPGDWKEKLEATGGMEEREGSRQQIQNKGSEP